MDRETAKTACLVHSLISNHEQKELRPLENLLLRGKTAYEEALHQVSLMEKVANKGWRRAEEKISIRMANSVAACTNLQCDISRAVAKAREYISIPDPMAIAEELVAIRKNFNDFSYDKKSGEISITTDTITLEGVGLGEFKIHLLINGIGGRNYKEHLRIEALDPNPANGAEDVTHPHLIKETLCAGNGSEALSDRLSECNLQDFLDIVTSILNTYNSGSAFVKLDAWYGIQCSECGESTREDDLTACHYDGDMYCSSCISRCRYCNRYAGNDHSSFCRICNQTSCSGCSYSCEECGETMCRGCCFTCSSCGETSNSTCINCAPSNKKCDSCVSFCTDCGEEIRELDTEYCEGCEEPICESCQEEKMCETCIEERKIQNDLDPDLKLRRECVGQAGLPFPVQPD